MAFEIHGWKDFSVQISKAQLFHRRPYPSPNDKVCNNHHLGGLSHTGTGTQGGYFTFILFVCLWESECWVHPLVGPPASGPTARTPSEGTVCVPSLPTTLPASPHSACPHWLGCQDSGTERLEGIADNWHFKRSHHSNQCLVVMGSFPFCVQDISENMMRIFQESRLFQWFPGPFFCPPYAGGLDASHPHRQLCLSPLRWPQHKEEMTPGQESLPCLKWITFKTL